MSGHLRVITPGARSLVQDLGFRRARAHGVPGAGVLDREGLFLVNALLGNPAGTEMLELALTSPVLRAEDAPVRVATGGGLTGRITEANGHERALPEWTATTLAPGAVLRLGPPARGGTALFGIGGGLDLPEVMGSRSTLLRAAFGGFHGRALAEGDVLRPRLPCPTDAPDRSFRDPPRPEDGPLRVVPGPQDERFTAAAWELFCSAAFEITPQSDRMGMRLAGPILQHRPGHGADIISDAVVPGAIQVPGDGRPIILLADAQTTGGYTKIASVIGADLSRLAAKGAGERLRFTPVSIADAEAAARARLAELHRLAKSIGPVSGGFDETALYRANLISGAIDMRGDRFPGHLPDDD